MSYTALSLHVCDISFLKRDSFLFSMYGCFAGMYVNHIHAMSWGPEEDIGCPRTGITDSISHHDDADN